MFVYRPKTLEKTVEVVDAFRSRIGIYHAPSRMSLSFVIYNDPTLPLSSPIQYPSKSFSDAEVSVMNSRYDIRGLGLGTNTFTFLRESYNPKKTTLENFKLAIDIFEEEIYKRLREEAPEVQPPNDPTPPDEEQTPPEEESELPKVGDFIRNKKRYGRVTDVDVEARAVTISPMTKDDVLNNMREIKNQGLLTASDTYKNGGVLGLPKVGDMVASNGQFGRVISVDQKTRVVQVKKMSIEQMQKNTR